MRPDQALELMNQLLWTAMLTAGPILIACLAVGLVVSVFQVATQLQEATLSYVPKLVVTGLMLVALGGWMIHEMMAFSLYVIRLIPSLG